MRPVFPYLVAAFTGFSGVVVAQDPEPILVVPDPVATEDTLTVPPILPVEALPLDERPLDEDAPGEVPAGALPLEEFPPEPPPFDRDLPETRPDAPVSTGLDDDTRAASDSIAGRDRVDPAAAEVPAAPVLLRETSPEPPDTPASPGRFPDCADELLRAAHARLVDETVLRTYAIEAEVLRLCAERQELVNRILKQEFELAELVDALPERTTVAASPEAPTLPRVPATVAPGADAALPDPPVAAELAPDDAVTVSLVPDAVPAAAAAAAVVDGSWQHLVRYRVRADGGAWRAGIVSTYRPPLPPPVVLEDGTVLPGTPPEPEPPLEMVVAAGDALQGGLVVETITDTAVTVRGSAAGDEPRELRNDPGDAHGQASGDAVCATGEDQGGAAAGAGRVGGLDARDFIYCTVTMQ